MHLLSLSFIGSKLSLDGIGRRREKRVSINRVWLIAMGRAKSKKLSRFKHFNINQILNSLPGHQWYSIRSYSFIRGRRGYAGCFSCSCFDTMHLAHIQWRLERETWSGFRGLSSSGRCVAALSCVSTVNEVSKLKRLAFLSFVLRVILPRRTTPFKSRRVSIVELCRSLVLIFPTLLRSLVKQRLNLHLLSQTRRSRNTGDRR